MDIYLVMVPQAPSDELNQALPGGKNLGKILGTEIWNQYHMFVFTNPTQLFYP